MLVQLDFYQPFCTQVKNCYLLEISQDKNLAKCSCVKCPGNTASVLYEKYTMDLNDLLDKHAPEVSHTFIKGPAKWLSDSYLLTKAVRGQFERIWHKDKSPQNRARLC